MATDARTGVLSPMRALAHALRCEYEAVASEFALLNLRRIRAASALRKQSELAALNLELAARIDQKPSELIERAAQVQSLAAQLSTQWIVRVQSHFLPRASSSAPVRRDSCPTVVQRA